MSTAPRSLKNCPACNSMQRDLPSHMRERHGWSQQSSAAVVSLYDMRKRSGESLVDRNGKKKYPRAKKICPIAGCSKVTKNIGEHLQCKADGHQMQIGSKKYKQLLKEAQYFESTLMPKNPTKSPSKEAGITRRKRSFTHEELDKATQELAPLRDELSLLGSRLKTKQEEAKRLRNTEKELLTSVAEMFTVEQPNLQEIDLEISKLHNSNYDFELREQRSRRATDDQNYPPASVRPYIKGLVCELAHVSDERLSRILSWYAQAELKAALCETHEQQRTVYDLGYPAYCENLISGFAKKLRGRSGHDPNGLLPIDLPRPPTGFQSTINFAVNLLEFTQNNAYLRGTLFYSIFGNTVVLSDLDHAQRYREYLLRMNHRCPAILTMSGDLIASNGLMDPNRKCPARLEHLRYTFGELPRTPKSECLTHLTDLQNLNELRNAKLNTDILDKEVRQLEKDLRDRQIALLPKKFNFIIFT